MRLLLCWLGQCSTSCWENHFKVIREGEKCCWERDLRRSQETSLVLLLCCSYLQLPKHPAHLYPDFEWDSIIIDRTSCPLSNRDSVTSTTTALISATITYLWGRARHVCPSSPFTKTADLERLIRAERKALERGVTQHWKKDHNLISRWLNTHSIFHILSSRGLSRNPCTYYPPRCLSDSPQTAFCVQKVAVKLSAVSLPMLPKGTEERKVTGIVTRC